MESYEPLLAMTFIAPGLPLVYTSNEIGYDHEIEFFEKDAVVWGDDFKYAPVITVLSKLKMENKALASSNTDIEFLEPSDFNAIAFTRTSGDNKVIYVANLYYEGIKGVSIDLGIENAKCVMHYDGEKFDMTEKDVTAKDFENKDYNPYEFYVLTVN